MSVEENKAVYKKFFDEYSKARVDVDSVKEELFTADYGHHWHGGIKDFETMWGRARSRPPDYNKQRTIDDMIAEGDRISVWTTSIPGRQGREESLDCIIFRFSDGKIAESWNMHHHLTGRGPAKNNP